MGNPMKHTPEFRRRRFFNWFPLGLCYALLYMGRYNLTVGKTALGNLMTKEAFGTIFGVGAWVYALAFLINGPLTDKMGGRKSMLTGLLGAVAANLFMGAYLCYAIRSPVPTAHLTLVFTALYAVNMYFQSFGAVAIVKVNARWFHVRERGVFGAIFGIMISTGLWLAFDLNAKIMKSGFVQGQSVNGIPAVWWVFFAPAILMAAFYVLELFLLRDRP